MPPRCASANLDGGTGVGDATQDAAAVGATALTTDCHCPGALAVTARLGCVRPRGTVRLVSLSP